MSGKLDYYAFVPFVHPITNNDDICSYICKILDGAYVIAAWAIESKKGIDDNRPISDFEAGYFNFLIFDAKDIASQTANFRSVTQDIYRKYSLAYDKYPRLNTHRDILISVLFILGAEVSAPKETTTLKEIETKETCPECDGQKILKFGFYNRPCMACCSVPYVGILPK